MSRIENNLLMELPFSNLTDFEFRAVTGSWHFDLNNLTDIDLFNVIPNPDKFDQRDPDNMLSLPSSNYYSINRLNNYLNMLTNKKSISLFHCNIRSLPKNLNLLEEFIYSLNVKPDILAISETKLNDKTIINTDIRQYQFFHTDSKTAAGGAGLYISKDLHAIPRPDIKFNMELVESCWSEIINNNKPNVIIGCIYRHPKANMSDFTLELETIVKKLNEKNQTIYIMGDINIDFLKYGNHPNTEDYLDMLFSYNLLPLITKPTRITDYTSTLIDHIYTNAPIHNTVSGICLIDISDHLPVFCVSDTFTKKKKETMYFRDYSKLNKELYLTDMSSIDWQSDLNNIHDLHQLTTNCVKKVTEVVNKHAPLRKASVSKMKQFTKP